MKVGYTKKIRRLAADPQFDQLVQFGCDSVYIWGDAKRAGFSLSQCIESLRPGDELCVVDLAVLGFSNTKALPVEMLEKRLKQIAAQDAVITVVPSGETFKPDAAAVSLILGAAKRLTRKRTGKRPGPQTVHNYTDAQWREIAGVWRDPDYTNDVQRTAAVRALGERFRRFNRNVWYSRNKT